MEKHIAATITLGSLNGTARELKALFRDTFADCEKRGYSSLTTRVELNSDSEPEINVYGFQLSEILDRPDEDQKPDFPDLSNRGPLPDSEERPWDCANIF